MASYITVRDLFQKFNKDVSHLHFQDLNITIPDNVTLADLGPMDLGITINKHPKHGICTFEAFTSFQQVFDIHVDLLSFYTDALPDKNTPHLTEEQIADLLYYEICETNNQTLDLNARDSIVKFVQDAHMLHKKE